MEKQLIVLGIVVALVSLVWWYYPTLQDMRDASHREVKCKELWEKVESKDRRVIVADAEFFQANCSR
jgi:hypothetical protein